MTITSNNRSKALSLVSGKMKNNIHNYVKRHNTYIENARKMDSNRQLVIGRPIEQLIGRRVEESEVLARRLLNGAVASAQAIRNLSAINKTTREYLKNNAFDKRNINKTSINTINGPRSLGYLRTINTAVRNNPYNRFEFRKTKRRAMRQERGGVHLLPDNVVKRLKVDEMTDRNYRKLNNEKSKN